jgi:hypothetical protein
MEFEPPPTQAIKQSGRRFSLLTICGRASTTNDAFENLAPSMGGMLDPKETQLPEQVVQYLRRSSPPSRSASLIRVPFSVCEPEVDDLAHRSAPQQLHAKRHSNAPTRMSRGPHVHHALQTEQEAQKQRSSGPRRPMLAPRPVRQ